ncbi:MAG: carbon monoxide dehydrogenase subunit G [Chloroflexi bacterium]|nr:carbon monoxide dehydrogenase subunit G [Chloroflexota bacterium]
MEISGTYTFQAPRQAVWDAIMDPDALSQILPGCESLERVAENEFKGALNVRVGPVQGRFMGKVTLSELNEPESFHMVLDGRGAAGFVRGQGEARLEEKDGATVLTYSGEAQVGGRIAGVGQRMLDTTARSLTRQSLESLDKLIQHRLHPVEAAESEAPAPPDFTPPTEMDLALGVARDMYREYVPEEYDPYVRAGVVAAVVLAFLWILRSLLCRD